MTTGRRRTLNQALRAVQTGDRHGLYDLRAAVARTIGCDDDRVEVAVADTARGLHISIEVPRP